MRVGLVAAASAAALAIAAPAQAVLLDFTITGDYSASFQLDSEPVPDDVDDGTSFTLWDVPGFPDALLGVADLQFWNVAALGGMTILDFYGGLTLMDATGAQLYSGPESAPVFAPGTFMLTELFGTGEYTLVISEAGTPPPLPIPEPTSWALMIGGLGLAGMALRRDKRKATVSFQIA